MKTKEELNELKEEYLKIHKKLAELTENELKQVTGGGIVVDDYNYVDIEISLE